MMNISLILGDVLFLSIYIIVEQIIYLMGIIFFMVPINLYAIVVSEEAAPHCCAILGLITTAWINSISC